MAILLKDHLTVDNGLTVRIFLITIKVSSDTQATKHSKEMHLWYMETDLLGGASSNETRHRTFYRT